MGEASQLRWYEQLAMSVLKQGEIPHHVAFIMDGNRRFAKQAGERSIEGHSAGFARLMKALRWCLYMDVKVVTVFAFSMDNFKRASDEVRDLMVLAEQKFYEFLQEETLIQEYDVRVQVFGELSSLPESLQVAMAKVMRQTKGHSRSTLNICYAYSSEYEVQRASEAAVEGVNRGELEPSDVSDDLINSCLYSSGARDPDVLIRTSGETRLSDYLLWQVSHSHVAFVKSLWPDFTLWDMCSVLLGYQRSFQALQKQRAAADNDKAPQGHAAQERIRRFLARRTEQQFSHLDAIVNSAAPARIPDANSTVACTS